MGNCGLIDTELQVWSSDGNVRATAEWNRPCSLPDNPTLGVRNNSGHRLQCPPPPATPALPRVVTQPLLGSSLWPGTDSLDKSPSCFSDRSGRGHDFYHVVAEVYLHWRAPARLLPIVGPVRGELSVWLSGTWSLVRCRDRTGRRSQVRVWAAPGRVRATLQEVFASAWPLHPGL